MKYRDVVVLACVALFYTRYLVDAQRGHDQGRSAQQRWTQSKDGHRGIFSLLRHSNAMHDATASNAAILNYIDKTNVLRNPTGTPLDPNKLSRKKQAEEGKRTKQERNKHERSRKRRAGKLNKLKSNKLNASLDKSIDVKGTPVAHRPQTWMQRRHMILNKMRVRQSNLNAKIKEGHKILTENQGRTAEMKKPIPAKTAQMKLSEQIKQSDVDLLKDKATVIKEVPTQSVTDTEPAGQVATNTDIIPIDRTVDVNNLQIGLSDKMGIVHNAPIDTPTAGEVATRTNLAAIGNKVDINNLSVGSLDNTDTVHDNIHVDTLSAGEIATKKLPIADIIVKSNNANIHIFDHTRANIIDPKGTKPNTPDVPLGSVTTVIDVPFAQVDVGSFANVVSEVPLGTANVGSGEPLGTANFGSGVQLGTANIGSGVSLGTANIGSGEPLGTANVGSGVQLGTANVGSEVPLGTANIGSGEPLGTANVGSGEPLGTANVGSGEPLGTPNVGSGETLGTANIGSGVPLGTVNVGSGGSFTLVDIGSDQPLGPFATGTNAPLHPVVVGTELPAGSVVPGSGIPMGPVLPSISTSQDEPGSSIQIGQAMENEAEPAASTWFDSSLGSNQVAVLQDIDLSEFFKTGNVNNVSRNGDGQTDKDAPTLGIQTLNGEIMPMIEQSRIPKRVKQIGPSLLSFMLDISRALHRRSGKGKH